MRARAGFVTRPSRSVRVSVPHSHQRRTDVPLSPLLRYCNRHAPVPKTHTYSLQLRLTRPTTRALPHFAERNNVVKIAQSVFEHHFSRSFVENVFRIHQQKRFQTVNNPQTSQTNQLPADATLDTVNVFEFNDDLGDNSAPPSTPGQPLSGYDSWFNIAKDQLDSLQQLPVSDQTEIAKYIKQLWKGECKWDTVVDKANEMIFNHQGFRPLQRIAINVALSRKNMFLSLQTGAGKSVCFMIPAIIERGITFVVSPLVALIQDQLQKLTAMGISACFLTGELSQSEKEDLFTTLLHPENSIKLVYLTPEQVSSDRFQRVLDELRTNGRIARFVIDEAHCVSAWGHDFRPSYLQLVVFAERFPEIPVTAATATASVDVRNDIIKCLKLSRVIIIESTSGRANLALTIKRKEVETVVDEIYEHISTKFPNQSGIIYCLTRNDCERVCEELKAYGLESVAFYHAEIGSQKRREVQDDFMSGKIKVIVATIAFGMGIDKKDVRFVIHHTMAKNLEDYIQQSGRAGRDGLPAEALLFFSFKDKFRIEAFENNKDESDERKKKRSASSMVDYALNTGHCRSTYIVKYMNNGQGNFPACGICDVCVNKKSGSAPMSSAFKKSFSEHMEEQREKREQKEIKRRLKEEADKKKLEKLVAKQKQKELKQELLEQRRLSEQETNNNAGIGQTIPKPKRKRTFKKQE